MAGETLSTTQVTSEVISYVESKKYWEEVDATVDGMLGGFSKISHLDTTSSYKFLSKWFAPIKGQKKMARANNGPVKEQDSRPTAKLALDCGAGIGRVTKHLLLNFSEEVDLLEQNQAFLDKSVEYIESERVGIRICSNLQSFDPAKNGRTYDFVWCQWVTGYLTDDDFVRFLVRCRKHLVPNHGMIFVKDNVSKNEDGTVDMDDSSITRPKESLLKIFRSAGLVIVEDVRQTKFPRGLFPVYSFALKPVEDVS